MRAIRFLPLAFLADVHGFVLFAPYVVLVMVAAQAVAMAERRRLRAGRLRVFVAPAMQDAAVLLAVASDAG